MINNPLIENTLKLLATALDEDAHKDDFLDYSQWGEIEKELQAQTVLPLVSNCVMRSNLDDREKLELTKKTAVNIRAFHHLMKAQTALFNLLESGEILAVVLKGAAAAQYYPTPSLRCFGDIDVLVLPEDYERAFNLLIEAGYQNLQNFDSPYTRHISFQTPEGEKIELHRYFSTSDSEEQNHLLDAKLYNQIKAREKINLDGYPVLVFPTLENGLVLLEHINHHLRDGLGLRQIVDWLYYVRQELDDSFWETQFKNQAEAIGLAYFAKTITKMCQIHLGLTSEIHWCDDADEALADELMLYILKKGNFGTKLNQNFKKRLGVAHRFKNLKSFFQYLTRTGISHMKADGRKTCKAIAWLYQVGYLLCLAMKGEGSELVEALRTGAKENDLLKRLKVTRK